MGYLTKPIEETLLPKIYLVSGWKKRVTDQKNPTMEDLGNWAKDSILFEGGGNPGIILEEQSSMMNVVFRGEGLTPIFCV